MNKFPPGTGETKEGWPKNVHVISMEQLDLIGIDPKTRKLYWDGQELETTTAYKLKSYERIVASLASLSAFGIFCLEFGAALCWW